MKRIPLWIATLALASPVLASGCGTQAADYGDCLDRYVVPAGTQEAARQATTFCEQVTGEGHAPADVAFARCMLPKMSQVNTDIGIEAAARVCRSQ